MTLKFLTTAAIAGLLGTTAFAAPAPTEEAGTRATEAPAIQLSASDIDAVLTTASNVPPNCQVYYFPDPETGEQVCNAVVCNEDDPSTPWYDPTLVIYDCSEFGL